MTKEQQLVLKAWKRFVKAVLTGDQEKMFTAFTKRLYNHLIQHCSFIAHYNRHGFFDVYFTEPEKTGKFFTQFDRMKGCASVEYGMTYWLKGFYEELHEAMIEAADEHLEKLYELCQDRQRDHDVAQAEALVARHGLKVTG